LHHIDSKTDLEEPIKSFFVKKGILVTKFLDNSTNLYNLDFENITPFAIELEKDITLSNANVQIIRNQILAVCYTDESIDLFDISCAEKINQEPIRMFQVHDKAGILSIIYKDNTIDFIDLNSINWINETPIQVCRVI